MDPGASYTALLFWPGRPPPQLCKFHTDSSALLLVWFHTNSSWGQPEWVTWVKWKTFLTKILKGCIDFGAYAREILSDGSWVSTFHSVADLVVAAREKRETITSASYECRVSMIIIHFYLLKTSWHVNNKIDLIMTITYVQYCLFTKMNVFWVAGT